MSATQLIIRLPAQCGLCNGRVRVRAYVRITEGGKIGKLVQDRWQQLDFCQEIGDCEALGRCVVCHRGESDSPEMQLANGGLPGEQLDNRDIQPYSTGNNQG
ncbi:MAG TPA: hypothetical protein PK157_19905 [Bryobacteraceae bacterium]|nr:hypothetical protein [Bryobacteraceae bacterium]